MYLPLKIYPDKILRKPGEMVKFPLTAPLKKLIKDMLDTVRETNGIGLAAPQVGVSARVIIINLEHLNVPAFALINPEITKFSKTKSQMEEGCLSIPGVFGMVDRPEKISLKAHDLKGNPISALEVDGLMSKVIQHEIDHINGVLIIDKIKKYTQGKELIK
jgi:peptide deformylase